MKGSKKFSVFLCTFFLLLGVSFQAHAVNISDSMDGGWDASVWNHTLNWGAGSLVGVPGATELQSDGSLGSMQRLETFATFDLNSTFEARVSAYLNVVDIAQNAYLLFTMENADRSRYLEIKPYGWVGSNGSSIRTTEDIGGVKSYAYQNFSGETLFDHALLFWSDTPGIINTAWDVKANTFGTYDWTGVNDTFHIELFLYGNDAQILDAGDLGVYDFSLVQPAAVPEPASLLLLGSGLAGLFGISRKRAK